MSVSSWVLWVLITAAPTLVFVFALRQYDRAPHKLRLVVATMMLGAAVFVPVFLIERWIERSAHLDEQGIGSEQLALLLYTFLVMAPLEQGAKVLSVAPVWRSKFFHDPIDGILYGAASALGFVTARNAVFMWGRDLVSLVPVRALLAIPAHLFFAAAWGYALGREPNKRIGGRMFNACWIAAMIFNALYDHMVFRLGPGALVGTLPILVFIGFVALVAARDLLRRNAPLTRGPSSRTSRLIRSSFQAIAPPSLGAMREALRRSERPIMWGWIVIGALTTTGVITAALVFAVALGHQVGIDFAAIDRAAGLNPVAGPLALLAMSVLVAFPIASYLVARASRARTILEPALSCAVVIAVTLVLLGLAAPLAVVFALAFAPIAFGLGCVGAWLGVVR